MERYYFEKQRECKKKFIFDHHIVRKSQICCLNKLTSKELYLILIDANTVKPTAQDYFENLFESSDFNWKKIYFLIRNTTLDTKARMFQYKVLHNTLYVNKMLFKFGKVISPRCSFCKLHEETIMHLFYDCLIVKRIWNQLKSILSNNLIFPFINLIFSCVAVGATVWGVVGVLFSWGGMLVLSFLLLLFCYYVCSCVLTTVILIIDLCKNFRELILALCNCYSYCCFLLYFCVFVKIINMKKNIKKKKKKRIKIEKKFFKFGQKNLQSFLIMRKM